VGQGLSGIKQSNPMAIYLILVKYNYSVEINCYIFCPFNAGRQTAKAPQLPENLENILKKFEKVFFFSIYL
jgi:hypothetical protein